MKVEKLNSDITTAHLVFFLAERHTEKKERKKGEEGVRSKEGARPIGRGSKESESIDRERERKPFLFFYSIAVVLCQKTF